MKTLSPTGKYLEFNNKWEMLSFLKACGAENKKRKYPRDEYLYKGIYVDEPYKCQVKGHIGINELIIEFEDGSLHSIHPKYLGEMQSKNFNRYKEKGGD